MRAPEVAIHVVSEANAALLETVDDDVFDNLVQPDLLRAYRANPANLRMVAVVQEQPAVYVCPLSPAKDGSPDDA